MGRNRVGPTHGPASAAPNLANAYRSHRQVVGAIPQDAVAGTYLSRNNGNAVVNGGSGANPLSIFTIVAADLAVPGKTAKLRSRVSVNTNATDPTLDLTFGIYPVTFAGGADVITHTMGTVVSGSQVAFTDAELAASSSIIKAGSDFDLPANGVYGFGVVTSALFANNAFLLFTYDLQLRYV